MSEPGIPEQVRHLRRSLIAIAFAGAASGGMCSMGPILNWYKLVPIHNDAGESLGRVLIHGDRTVKSGSPMELRGVHYPPSPVMLRFELQRYHWRSKEFVHLDYVPASFYETPHFSYTANSPSMPLRSRHSRILNRTFRFVDDQGNPSASIATARFGHFQVTQAEFWTTAGTAAHVPYGNAKLHMIAQPMKDPYIELSVLLPDGVRRLADLGLGEFGYRGLGDLLGADEHGVEIPFDDVTNVRLPTVLSPGLDIRLEPADLQIGDREVGYFELTLLNLEPGTTLFAVQGVCDPASVDWKDDPDDSLDGDLLGVLVSPPMSLTFDPDSNLIVLE